MELGCLGTRVPATRADPNLPGRPGKDRRKVPSMVRVILVPARQGTAGKHCGQALRAGKLICIPVSRASRFECRMGRVAGPPACTRSAINTWALESGDRVLAASRHHCTNT